MNKKKYLIGLCSILIIMIFSITFISKKFENDLFFDIKTGECLLKYGIDFKDHFSFITDLTYIYHHYLYNLIVYFLYRFTGYNGLFIFFNFCFTIFGLIVLYINKKYTKKHFFSIIITLFTMFICCYSFQSRVQSITYILFYLEVFFLNELYEKGNKKYSVFLIIISILIANLHMPLWIFSIVLFLPYLFEFIFKCFIDKRKKINDLFSDKLIIKYPYNKKIFIITILMMLFCGFLTPLKLYPYTFFTKSLFNDSYLFIQEMKATFLINYRWEIILLFVFILLIILNKVKFKVRDLCLILGLFIFSLIANRNVIYFYIFCPTILVKTLCQSKLCFEFKLKKIKYLFKNVNIKIVLIFTNILLIFIYIFCIFEMDFQNFDYGINDIYPVESVKYLKENVDYGNIKLYNHFNYGSYLEFNDIPVFIDSRAEVYLKEYNGGTDIVSDYLKTFNFSTYKEIFDKYQFDYALVYNKTEVYYYLKNDNDFEIIYQEDSYVLFKKNN